MVVLVDIGNTHNFINRSKVKVVHCFVHLVNNFQIIIAKRGMMKYGGHCENIKLKMGNYHLKIGMFSIDIVGSDSLLRFGWFSTLRPITMDFKELYMSFSKDCHTHFL